MLIDTDKVRFSFYSHKGNFLMIYKGTSESEYLS